MPSSMLQAWHQLLASAQGQPHYTNMHFLYCISQKKPMEKGLEGSHDTFALRRCLSALSLCT